jgi:ElaB/YqjD/DUF883 family membrane-anchored ribosome-binding protein
MEPSCAWKDKGVPEPAPPGHKHINFTGRKNMAEMNQVNKDKFVADLKVVVADAEELVKLTAGTAGDKLADVRSRLAGSLADIKLKLGDLEAVVVEKTKLVARATDDYVHENPWRSIGAAAGAAFLLGLLVGRR